MERYGIQQYLEDDLNDGDTLTEALDRAFDEIYVVFCNSLRRYGTDETVFVKEEDVLALLEKCFKRKYQQP